MLELVPALWRNTISFGTALGALPTVVFFGVIFAAAVFYRRRANAPEATSRKFRKLVFVAVAFQAFYATLVTVSQYYVWSQNPLTQPLLESPVGEEVPLSPMLRLFPFLRESNLGYFLFYSWGRFWFEVVITIVAVSVAYFQGALVRPLRAAMPYVERIGSVFLVGAGTYLVYYWFQYGRLLV